MNSNLFLTYVIIFIILFGLTLPVNYLIIRTVISVLGFIKKLIIEDEDGILEKYKKIALEEQLIALQEKERLGAFRYYTQHIKNWFKKHSFILYVSLLLFVLVFSYFSFNKTVIELPVIQVPEWAGYIFFPIILFLTIGYFLAKTEKTKWILQFAVIVYIGVRLLWDVLILKTVESVGLVGWFVGALVLCMIHYKKWEKEQNEKVEQLKAELKKECYSTNLIIAEYKALLEQRHDNKKHFNMLYHLNEEKEISAIQEYLAQLEKERMQPNEVERKDLK